MGNNYSNQIIGRFHDIIKFLRFEQNLLSRSVPGIDHELAPRALELGGQWPSP